MHTNVVIPGCRWQETAFDRSKWFLTCFDLFLLVFVELAAKLPQKLSDECREFRPRSDADDMQERWLSVDEIAAHLGVNPDTIYKWIDRKNLPAHKVGRLWKFKASEVDEWIQTGKAGDNEQ